MKKSLSLILGTLILWACYTPEPFEAKVEDGESSSQVSKIGTLYAVNGKMQTCNPSVSNDTVNYPASMLWLNFSNISVKPGDSTFSTKDVEEHDRLTVTDTSNTVRWFLMIDAAAGDCEFQDPEWSTHPDYIVALRAFDKNGSKACEDLDYGMFAVRMSDKKIFKFYDKDMSEFSTPHLWVGNSSKDSVDAADSSVVDFFGTTETRLTYVNKDNEIVFVDFANGGLKKANKLKKPSDRKSWQIDSPLISPDGKYVVYNMTSGSATWEAYIQELSSTSVAVRIEQERGMLSAPAQPHWFNYAGHLYVVWAEFTNPSMLNRIDLSSESVQGGSAGRTVMREINLVAGAPRDLAFEWVGDIRELAPIPMTGGRSPDGKFLSTGTNPAFLLKLP